MRHLKVHRLRENLLLREDLLLRKNLLLRENLLLRRKPRLRRNLNPRRSTDLGRRIGEKILSIQSVKNQLILRPLSFARS